MIKNKTDYIFYRESDRIISGRNKKTFFDGIKLFFIPDSISDFMTLLRTVEYYENCSKNILDKIKSKYFKHKFRKKSLQLGFSIPPNVFGPGLFIPHYGTIVINSKATVGANCVLHTSTCITAKDYIEMGNNVYISTGAIIAGNLKINDNVTIGANSLLNKSFNETDVLLAGSPATIIKKRKAWYLEDGVQYENRVNEIMELKKKLYSH